MKEFKKELKELLKKHEAVIEISTDGEGYSMSIQLEIYCGDKLAISSLDEISQHSHELNI